VKLSQKKVFLYSTNENINKTTTIHNVIKPYAFISSTGKELLLFMYHLLLHQQIQHKSHHKMCGLTNMSCFQKFHA